MDKWNADCANSSKLEVERTVMSEEDLSQHGGRMRLFGSDARDVQYRIKFKRRADGKGMEECLKIDVEDR